MHRYAGLVRINRCGRLAYVVTKPVIYGMFRLAAAFANGEGATVDAIRTLDEALTWLGRKTDAGDAKRPRSRCGTLYSEPPDATSRRSSAMS